MVLVRKKEINEKTLKSASSLRCLITHLNHQESATESDRIAVITQKTDDGKFLGLIDQVKDENLN